MSLAILLALGTIGKTALHYDGATYYDNIHSLFITVDEGPHGAREFRSSAEVLAHQFRLGDGDCQKVYGKAASRKGIEKALKNLAARSTNKDRVVVDLIGHGQVSQNGTVNFVAGDAKDIIRKGDPGLLPMKTILTLFKAIPARHKWLILDACYAGNLIDRLSPIQPTSNLKVAHSKSGACVWLGSYIGERTLYEPNGLTSLHGMMASVAREPKFEQDLEAFQYAVSRQQAKFSIGVIKGNIGQMYLGPRDSNTSGVQNSTNSAFQFDRYDEESVKKAVARLENLLQRTDGIERAKLQVECARAHVSWPVPTEYGIHIDRAIELLGFAKDTLEGSERRNAMAELGHAYWLSPSANRKKNLEQSAELFRIVLKKTEKSVDPMYWARTQYNLASVLISLAPVNSKFIPEALSRYELADSVFQRDPHPVEWSMNQNAIGNAYLAMKEHRGENLLKAIKHYQDSLTIRTRTTLPLDWAATKHNLGVAYSGLPTNRDANHYIAIGHIRDSQTVLTKKEFSKEWANTENSLGIAYSEISTDRLANLQRAIECYKSVLEIKTKDAFKLDWASTQNNLGLAYREMPGVANKVENLQRAIECFDAALTVFSRDQNSSEWANTMNSRGLALQEIPKDLAKNRAAALISYNAALTVYTKKDKPQEWAHVQLNLANLFVSLPSEEQSEKLANLARAEACYQASLEVFTMEADPENYCLASFGLARAYIFHGRKQDSYQLLKGLIEFGTKMNYVEFVIRCKATIKLVEPSLKVSSF